MSEIAQLREKIRTLNAQVRYWKDRASPEVKNLAFTDKEKLMMIEGCLASVINTDKLDIITKAALYKINDIDFWKKHRDHNIVDVKKALEMALLN